VVASLRLRVFAFNEGPVQVRRLNAKAQRRRDAQGGGQDRWGLFYTFELQRGCFWPALNPVVASLRLRVFAFNERPVQVQRLNAKAQRRRDANAFLHLCVATSLFWPALNPVVGVFAFTT
jgi:hypothetical protein